jgi:hypothetical protein
MGSKCLISLCRALPRGTRWRSREHQVLVDRPRAGGRGSTRSWSIDQEQVIGEHQGAIGDPLVAVDRSRAGDQGSTRWRSADREQAVGQSTGRDRSTKSRRSGQHEVAIGGPRAGSGGVPRRGRSTHSRRSLTTRWRSIDQEREIPEGPGLDRWTAWWQSGEHHVVIDRSRAGHRGITRCWSVDHDRPPVRARSGEVSIAILFRFDPLVPVRAPRAGRSASPTWR